MAKVLLGVTGSVAAIRTPELLQTLRRAGHEVKIVATRASLYFFDPREAMSSEVCETSELCTKLVIVDEDEWPGLHEGRRYRRGDAVLHIELRRWADLLLVAPLDANTLAKLANGLSDNCLTCVWRAWDPANPVVLAPAMNTFMWEHPLTGQHFRLLAIQAGARSQPALDASLDAVVEWMNRECPRLRMVAPQSKRLACGDVGVGAMAELDAIAAAAASLL